MLKKALYSTLTLSMLMTMQACSTVTPGVDHSSSYTLASNARVVVVPFYNTSDTESAGATAAIMTSSELQIKHIEVANIPFRDHKKMKHNEYRNMSARCAWAKDHNISYIMKGSINEWGYIKGSTGEVPVVAMTMQLRDTSTCKIVWNAVGNKTETSAIIASGTAQRLISTIVNSLNGSN